MVIGKCANPGISALDYLHKTWSLLRLQSEKDSSIDNYSLGM
ncbi:hypothetical protein H1P_1200020 [Hyella patelloides LEGE 07179]|uniref:Uncharacterized protein n=1 Tax=Hyella patelloides LEGE 07179 TaxID=945734 RepID=A0A563VKD5_9CYAN|nr:hypothetical protein H1P_1200020 [Hyella patelloides LEGE 07179]